MLATRTSWQVTRSVWHALFMREAIARTTADRMAWFWMLFEPLAMVAIMVAIRAVILDKGGQVAGAPFIPWLIVGLFGFFLFRENMLRLLGAIEANHALFAYRQVQPVDTVLVRSFLEGILKTVVFLLFIGASPLLGIELVPDAALEALLCWLMLWLLGLGYGLVLSALSRLIPEVGRIVKLTSLPLLIISGVMFPLNFLPWALQQYLLLNPVVHGLELMRSTFFTGYQPIEGVSLMYLLLWILTMLTLGLMLHLRYSDRMKKR